MDQIKKCCDDCVQYTDSYCPVCKKGKIKFLFKFCEDWAPRVESMEDKIANKDW